MSGSSDEAEQEASLALYKEQLSQVDQAINLSGETTDLMQLKNDLKELITLTEENLLQLKKARLLKSLEESPEVSEPSGSGTNISFSEPGDDEYAAFQASISQLSPPDTKPTQSSSSPALFSKPLSSDSSTQLRPTDRTSQNHGKVDDGDKNSIDVSSSSSSSDGEDDQEEDVAAALSHMIGTKCQAPIKNDWGGHHYGNAMIWSIDALSALTHSTEYMVRVIFLNPTQPSMIPCSYYMDGACRFSDETCRRSHGQAVLVSELKPYLEPDYSKICEGCRCLAKSSDDVWYPATVTDVCDDQYVNVRFDLGDRESSVLVEHVKPITDEDDAASSDSEGEGSSTDLPSTSLHKIDKREEDDEDDDDDDGLPVYLWRPSQTTERLGAWEAHTRGVGSRLMEKMGYIHGQGLGKSGEGRAEPVPIMLLPQGKSLDKIMELKEMAGNADLFNAMKKLEKQQKVMEKKAAEREKRREEKSHRGVFGFLNKKLDSLPAGKNGSGHAHPSGHAHSSRNKRDEATPTPARELGKRSDKEVNLQIFKTSEEIRAVERHLVRLRQQLARNESRDRKMADQVSQKIAEQESYLQQLKTSSQTLERHKQSRSAHKKLTIF